MQIKKYTTLITAFVLFVVTGLTYNLTLVNATADQSGAVLGDQDVVVESVMEGAEGAEAPVVQKIEYTLPYPGILPDHPLYNLKRFRDYVLERLISDPVRKIEFYTLQGDKRLAMGITLSGQGKSTLAESTISKGEKYMEKAVSGISALRAEGKTVPPYIIENVKNALAKHAETITLLMQTAPDTEKAGLTGSLTLVGQLKENVTQ